MKYICTFFILILCISCQRDEEISSRCYSDNPVTEFPWFNAVVKKFQQPGSGPLTVASYKYKGEAFLVISNPAVSSPASYIYTCSGQNIAQLGIHYNAFTDDAKLIEVFIDEKY